MLDYILIQCSGDYGMLRNADHLFHLPKHLLEPLLHKYHIILHRFVFLVPLSRRLQTVLSDPFGRRGLDLNFSNAKTCFGFRLTGTPSVHKLLPDNVDTRFHTYTTHSIEKGSCNIENTKVSSIQVLR